MNELRVKLFPKQDALVFDPKRIVGGFAGKRGGKTEGGAIRTLLMQENKPNFNPKSRDPYLNVIVAPTHAMLVNLSWKKFLIYSAPFIKRQWNSPVRILWKDNSEVLGLSADKPKRIEGLKANHLWADEIFQMEEQAYLEFRMRVADSKGYLTLTGSLGVQYINPKQHWAYKFFKENPDENTSCHEWATKDNPYFPEEEITSLKNKYDPRTFRQLMEIDWDTPPLHAVYENFDSSNEIDYVYNPMLPVYCVVDWGWTHPMACLFIQYDARADIVYVFSEIIQSKLKIEDLHQKILSMPFKIDCFICDIAGKKEDEQMGLSNVDWFRGQGIYFQYRTSSVLKGVALVRSYIKNVFGFPRLFVDKKCKLLLDGIKRYKYKEVDGIVQNENPLKEDDDAVDALRYFFVNILDTEYNQPRSHIRTKY